MKDLINASVLSRVHVIFILLVFVIAVPVSATVSPTIDSATPSTLSVVNGGTAIVTVSGTCGAQITSAKFEMKNPQGVNTIAGFFDTTTNGNQWSGKISYAFSPSLQSGQYNIWRISIQDSAGNFVSKELVPTITINLDNSEKNTSSTSVQTTSPTPIPTITSLITTTSPISSTTAFTTIQTTARITDFTTSSPIITTTAVPTHSPTTLLPTNTATQQTPLGIEIGIIAIFTAFLILKRK